jgi:Protein of unknown function (DUF1566)
MSPLSGTLSIRRDRLWAAIALSGLLVGCGGGGGAPDVPRFERITVSGNAAVRDNVTGIVWAGQLGACADPSLQPAAFELGQLADLGASTLRPYFAFVPDAPSPNAPLIKAKEAVVNGPTGTVWAVDFGRVELGGLSNQATGDTSAWCVLSRTSATPTITYPTTPATNGTVTAAGLTWKVCTEGSTWDWTGDISTSVCRHPGTPVPVTIDAVQALVDTANRDRFAGATGWRLPTKNELSALLQLENDLSTSTLLPAVFDNTDSLGTVPVYWSSSRSADSTKAWTVDYSDSTNPGGVVLAPLTDSAYVRLVRTAP